MSLSNSPPTGPAKEMASSAGSGMGQKIRTAEKKSMSSQQWIKRQLADEWSERARAEGWRSRAAFKLMEIDDRHFKPVKAEAPAAQDSAKVAAAQVKEAECCEEDGTTTAKAQ